MKSVKEEIDTCAVREGARRIYDASDRHLRISVRRGVGCVFDDDFFLVNAVEEALDETNT